MATFVKLPSHVGLTKFMTGEWKLETLKQYIDEGIIGSPSRKTVDEMVQIGTHVVEVRGESKEFQFTAQMREKLIKADVVSAKVAVPQAKREFVSKEQKDLYDLFQRGNELMGRFIEENEVLQTIANLRFKDEEGAEFQVVPSHYLKNISAALNSFIPVSE